MECMCSSLGRLRLDAPFVTLILSTSDSTSNLVGAGLGTAGSVDAAAAAADTALAEVQQQLQALYVQRRLQALHPRVDSYLTTLTLSTPAPAAATKLSPLPTASTSTAAMPIPSGGGAAQRVSGELLHVVHGLLAVQVRVVLLAGKPKTRHLVSMSENAGLEGRLKAV